MLAREIDLEKMRLFESNWGLMNAPKPSEVIKEPQAPPKSNQTTMWKPKAPPMIESLKVSLKLDKWYLLFLNGSIKRRFNIDKSFEVDKKKASLCTWKKQVFRQCNEWIFPFYFFFHEKWIVDKVKTESCFTAIHMLIVLAVVNVERIIIEGGRTIWRGLKEHWLANERDSRAPRE